MVTTSAEEQSDDIVILFSGDNIHGSVDENLGLTGLEAYAKESGLPINM